MKCNAATKPKRRQTLPIELPDAKKTTFEITTIGKAALAWEDREKPRVISKRGKPDSEPMVQACHGVDMEPDPPTHYEDAVEVAMSGWDPETPSVFLGICWQHDRFRQTGSGPLTERQLDQLIELLTVAKDEAKRIGLFKKRPRLAADPPHVDGEADLDPEDLPF